jgi:membrane protein YqaA with SNARE-associated domain
MVALILCKVSILAVYTGSIMEIWMHQLISLLALPQYSLSTVFLVAFFSATMLPMVSEPVVFGLVTINPAMFWPVMFVATAGSSLGSAVNWWMGYGSVHIAQRINGSFGHNRALHWLQNLGAKACLLAWVPIVGDPLCLLAGWLKMPFWSCLIYIVAGKFVKYVLMTAGLVYLWP